MSRVNQMNESIFNQMIDSFDSFVSVTFHELPKTKEGSVRCEDRRTTVNPNINLNQTEFTCFLRVLIVCDRWQRQQTSLPRFQSSPAFKACRARKKRDRDSI
jgi:hypothetical protein